MMKSEHDWGEKSMKKDITGAKALMCEEMKRWIQDWEWSQR